MAVLITVNTDSLVGMQKKLQELNRSAFPVAIRNTLNNSAFDVKQNTLTKSAQKNFPHLKQKRFFKAFSGVEKATGFNIHKMAAKVGMLDMGKASARNAVQNMEKQEIGGVINDGFSYLKAARGEKQNGFVRRENYYDKNKVISGRSKVGRNRGTHKSKFVARAYKAFKEDKPMFLNSMKGNFLVKVQRIRKTKKGKLTIKMKLLMKERETVNIKPTHFVEEAAVETQSKISAMYLKEGEKQINKVWK